MIAGKDTIGSWRDMPIGLLLHLSSERRWDAVGARRSLHWPVSERGRRSPPTQRESVALQ